MDVVERYFWVVCGAVMTLNVMIWRGRLGAFVASGRVSTAEVESFTRGALVVTWVAVAAWWGLEHVLSVNVKCLSWLDPSQPGSLAFSSVTIGFAAAWLWWVWGAGGDLIARVPNVFFTLFGPDSEFEPSTVRLVITAVMLIGGVVATFMGSTRPPFPGCAG